MSRRKRKPRGNRRKSIYVLPNLFTTASLFAGFYAIISAIRGDFQPAAIAIMIAAVCDGLDGAVARATHSTSQFGVEYDSLADLVSFGTAPAVLGYLWALQPFGRLGWVAGFLYLACGALRLARFNVYAPTKDHSYFQGLPIPGAAVMVASTVIMLNYLGETGPVKHVAILVLIFSLSFLMVSNFKYLSLKNKSFFISKPFNALVVAVLLLALTAVRPQVVLFCFFFLYVISGPIVTVHQLRKQRRENPETGEPATDTAD